MAPRHSMKLTMATRRKPHSTGARLAIVSAMPGLLGLATSSPGRSLASSHSPMAGKRGPAILSCLWDSIGPL